MLAVSVYQCMNGFYPERISAMFDSTASVHSHNLRGSSNNIFIPRPRTEAGKRAFSYRGAVLWNSLPSDLRNQPNLKSTTLFRNNIVSLQFFVDLSRFSTCAINLSRNKNICCRLKKGVAKSRALVYFGSIVMLPYWIDTKQNNQSAR